MGTVVLRKSIVQAAISEARKSTEIFRMGAVIFSKKTIVSSSRNQACRSLKHLHPKFFKWPYSVHAEVGAVIQARQDISGMSILVVRLNRHGRFALAKPCKHCLTYLNYVHIKRVYYSINNSDEFELMKL